MKISIQVMKTKHIQNNGITFRHTISWTTCNQMSSIRSFKIAFKGVKNQIKTSGLQAKPQAAQACSQDQ